MSGGVTGRGRSHLEISELRSSDFLVVLRPSSHISTRLVRSLVCGIERAGTKVSCFLKGTFLHIKPFGNLLGSVSDTTWKLRLSVIGFKGVRSVRRSKCVWGVNVL